MPNADATDAPQRGATPAPSPPATTGAATASSGRRPAPGRVVVDRTHMSRRASGIERITEGLFSPEALAPLAVAGTASAGSRPAMIWAQMVANPAAALLDRGSVWVFPGYPPSPAFALMRDRSVLYVHDLFLLTRRQDLNRAAKLYMAGPFRLAVQRLRYFLTNSATTAANLAPFIRPDAEVVLYRPRVDNVFGLRPALPSADEPGRALRIGAVGTVEPRKNLLAGARLCRALQDALGRPVEFHVVGRRGWGEDYDALAALPHVRLHGFLEEEAARTLIQGFDLLLCTSHDEGLGLPLLELQYAGLPVVAPDQPVFREVLDISGTYIAPGEPEEAARHLASLLRDPDWRRRQAGLAAANLERWNGVAEADRAAVIAFLGRIAGAAASAG